MFINDKLIFLQLHKTGTSSIASFIHAVRPGKIEAKVGAASKI